jgi:hypothetical protein
VDLTTAERALQTAQRQGDVDALDALLHPLVVAAGPDGQVFTKADDLASYRSGALQVVELTEESLHVEEGETTGLTRMTASIEALQDGRRVTARLSYTRLWVRDGQAWRVIAATFAAA